MQPRQPLAACSSELSPRSLGRYCCAPGTLLLSTSLGTAVRFLDRVDEFGLRHRRTAAHVEAACDLEQVLLAGVGIHTLCGRHGVVQATALGPFVGRALLLFAFPVIADFFEAVLDGGIGDSVRTLFTVILFGGRIMRFGERPLRLGAG